MISGKEQREERIQLLVKEVNDFFGLNNITDVKIENGDNEGDFFLTCVIYKSNAVRFGLGETARLKGGGLFGASVYIGGIPVDIYSLQIEGPDNKPPLDLEEMLFSFDVDSIRTCFRIVDRYLRWTLTDTQKKTLHFQRSI